MMHSSLEGFLEHAKTALTKGPVALIFVEDKVEIATTLRHHLDLGFATVVVFMPDAFDIPYDLETRIERVPYDCSRRDAVFDAINKVIAAAAPGCWLYYCYNAEYLFYPFCESRNVVELLGFHAEERRDAMLSYVIDLYAGDLAAAPNGVSLDTAHLDKSGYYAQSRNDPQTGHPLDRQLDFYGGVRWRYEEHIPAASRKIDRISLFRAKPDLHLFDDHRFSEPEYNTYACPWHHNLTAAICSFRTAKALKRNPGSSFEIDNFRWHNSAPFDWHSRQLLDLGLMEPGQWF
ncbi:glycosyltransferase family 2 protein [Phaeobacter piscinae]|uniref:Glycosyl transferase family 2 n=1 Tax=Phaeobacter piscinae TaxID=1580596 RepID=A0AAN1GNU4_9RHOB|nr:glycosyltransferase family 2 protein [Phaeobacter piscinae]ATG38520.1 Glycosyl transferase family 2 [Phaeobacter piscinae]ATG42350.1 Glycosyl transferase family 2 [Phaeobacter piscinae]AUR34684.1 Glycosyl transferase family 2 [Phaeobacter piscinae]